MKKLFSLNLIWAFYLVYYILFAAVTNRELPNYLGTKDQWVVIFLFAAYALLLGLERLISRRFSKFVYIYFILQLGIILWLVLIPNEPADQDYFINLVLPLCGQAVWDLNKKIAKYFVVAFCIFCITTMVTYYPFSDGFSFGLSYVAGCVLVSVLSASTIASIQSQQKSQQLLEELTVANQKLKEYSLQIQQLAVAEERNRLARELHDSVTQVIFGMTLSAQAARILIDRDPPRAAAELDNLQALSQNALTEMRTLIQEMHPLNSMAGGLVPALQNLVNAHQTDEGLRVTLLLDGNRHLPEVIETELFRVAQEALNNIIKHAHAKQAEVSLDLENPTRVILVIRDDGSGFNPAQIVSLPGHIGLASMRERVMELGGSLSIDSQPGRGTSIRVEIELKQEVPSGQ
jgi:signal transduction histidine kinase